MVCSSTTRGYRSARNACIACSARVMTGHTSHSVLSRSNISASIRDIVVPLAGSWHSRASGACRATVSRRDAAMIPGSTFAARFARRTGALELMADLGAAMQSGGTVHMLGGGNPARIPAVEAAYRRRLVEIAADSAQFGRFAGQYSDPAGDPAFRDAVVAELSSRYGWALDRRNVALTAGSQLAFFFLFNWLAG